MKKLTTAEVSRELLSVGLLLLGQYIPGEKITVCCITCKHTRKVTSGRLLYSVRKGLSPCPKCSDRLPFTNTIVDDHIKDLTITRLSNVESGNIPLLWGCDVCQHQWYTKATKVVNDHTGCPKCSYVTRSKNRLLTNADIDNRVHERSIYRIGSYVCCNTKIAWGCVVCGNVWDASPNKIIHDYTGCPRCADVGGGHFGKKTYQNGILFDSKLEADCYVVLLTKFHVDDIVLQQRYYHNHRMTCDFVIPSINTWIEVSNLRIAEYLQRIEIKRQAIIDINETFIFCSHPNKLRKLYIMQ